MIRGEQGTALLSGETASRRAMRCQPSRCKINRFDLSRISTILGATNPVAHYILCCAVHNGVNNWVHNRVNKCGAPLSGHGAASIPGSKKRIPVAPPDRPPAASRSIQERGLASDRDTHDEDRYQFESGFIAVASRHPAQPAFFLHPIACARGDAAFVLIRGIRRTISRTRSFAHAIHRQCDDPV